MIVSQNGINLAATTSAILMVTIIAYFVEAGRHRKANKNAYEKLSKPNRQMIDILQETEKRATPTLSSIKTAYEKTVVQPIDSEQLLQKLTELETSQTIKRSIANVHDEPTQIWKTQVNLKQEKADKRAHE
jgi:hypothetical protein